MKKNKPIKTKIGDTDFTIEMAKQEQIRFVYKLVDVLIHDILEIRSFFITDESYVSDMTSGYPSSKAKKLDNGKYEITYNSFDDDRYTLETGKKSFFEATNSERKKYIKKVIEEVPEEEIFNEDEFLDKIENLFGVRLTYEDVNSSFVKLGQAISKSITPENRKKIEAREKEIWPPKKTPHKEG